MAEGVKREIGEWGRRPGKKGENETRYRERNGEWGEERKGRTVRKELKG